MSAKALALLLDSALGLLWGRAVASSGEFFSHHCAPHRVYIAYPRVSFLYIIRPAQAQKQFGVYAGIIREQRAEQFDDENEAAMAARETLVLREVFMRVLL